MNPHTFICVDAHTCGNPVRVVCGGAPILPNVSMAENARSSCVTMIGCAKR